MWSENCTHNIELHAHAAYAIEELWGILVGMSTIGRSNHVLPWAVHFMSISIDKHVFCEVNTGLHSPHRISAGGSSLFMRCVSLTLTGLVSAWRRGEAPWAILAKSLSDCVTVFCLRQCKSRHLNVCEILKNTCYFQTNWISCILNWGLRCDVVSDAGHTCCCCSFFLLTFPPPNWRTSLTTKIEVSVRQQR